MAKTVTPGSVDVPGVGTFHANALPDPFDARDLDYRPRLQPLPRSVDQRVGGRRHIYVQDGQSCTGHALAAVINTVLGQTRLRTRVSPYMLYRAARRYDEFPGEADAGSSLRGAFKGWFNHGAATERQWPTLAMSPEPDLDDDRDLRAWRARPLGAFYRINPYRLDDVQSAITELYAIAVSGVVHEGWRQPRVVGKGDRELHVIERTVNTRSLGGHAYCLVGYNEVGFLVQNSWGTDWGKGGFATLPYEDWLDTVYDAWVARTGVPQTPFSSGRSPTATATGGTLATGPGPDLRRLAYHVVTTANDGRLSAAGKVVSSPGQVDRLIDHMGLWHQYLLDHGKVDKRHIVLWAHGGGVSQDSGIEIADRQLNWWLNCGVYPISFVWETGAFETFEEAVEDAVRGLIPTAGLGFDFAEQADRLVEGFCRRRMRWSWREMKGNARAASDPLPDGNGATPGSSAGVDAGASVPGASLLVQRLAAYVTAHGPDNVALHLVAHSAGSVFQAAMLQRFSDAGLKVDTVTWLAPAITVAEFATRALPLLGSDKVVRQFSCFDLSDNLELDDTVGPIYHKSAVYLVARGFEDVFDGAQNEAAVLGLSKYWGRTIPGSAGPTLLQAVEASGGELVVARSTAPPDSRCDATTHAAFPDDAPTMTSVAMRIRGATSNPERYAYQPHAPLSDGDGGAAGAAGAGGGPAAPRRRGRGAAARQPLPQPVDTSPPGQKPLVETAEPPAVPPHVPAEPAPRRPIPEVAVAPRTGSPILDVLVSEGWQVRSGSAPAGPTAGPPAGAPGDGDASRG